MYNSTIAQVNFYRSVIADFLPRQHDPWTALCNTSTDASPTGTCYLMELPPELRELIWEFVLTSGDEIRLSRWPGRFNDHKSPGPALIRASIAVRNEALRVYCRCNQFLLRTRLDQFPQLARWLEELIDRRRVTQFGRLHFEVDGSCVSWTGTWSILPLVKLVASGRLRPNIELPRTHRLPRQLPAAKTNSPFAMLPTNVAGYVQLALEESMRLAERASHKGWDLQRFVAEFCRLELERGRGGYWWSKRKRYALRERREAEAETQSPRD